MRHRQTFLKVFLALILLGSLSAVLTICATYLYLSPKLPPIDVLREAKLQVPLRIYSQNGELIGEFGEKLRTPVSMTEVPEQFVNAILSAEDDRFLHHQGIDIGGLLRAAMQLFSSGEIQSGGSTITMQVARNFFLSREQTFVRKFNEIFLALQIEAELSKNEILELYVNKIYLGKRAYGIQAAAGVYYGKSIEELSLAQLAMIAGLPKAPSAFNPINNPQRAIMRRDWILGRMAKLGYISGADYKQAITAPVTAEVHGSKLELDAAYAAEMARIVALQQLGRAAYTDGYSVITTVDSSRQRSAERALIDGLNDYSRRHGYRGPEQQLKLNDRENWLDAIADLKPVNGLRAAVVTAVGTAVGTNTVSNMASTEEQATDTSANHDVFHDALANKDTTNREKNRLLLLLRDGSEITLEWDRKINPLRPFINEDRRGKSIESITEIINVGDVIRIRFDEELNTPLITQLPEASASIVALNPKDGAIQALVGGFDFQTSKFNRATQAYRQTGSNFKPFVYAAAMENGFTAASIINDAPIVFADNQLESDWRPENSGGKFYGPTTLRRALYLSRNLVSIRLLRELGISRAIEYLRGFEFNDRPLPRDLSLSLGSYSMTPLQMATAYASIANGGFKVNPYIVDRIEDRSGQVIYASLRDVACPQCEHDPEFNLNQVEIGSDTNGIQAADDGGVASEANNMAAATNAVHVDEFEEAESLEELLQAPPLKRQPAQRIIDARVAYIIDSILQDVIRRGTGTKAKVLGRSDLAGKTGTTNGPTDAWFSGYHPELVATAWLGFDDNQFLGKREYGGSAALPIWIDFMQASLADIPNAIRTQPAGMVSVKINRLTGLAAVNADPQNIFESFLEEYAPQQNQAPAADTTDDHLIFDEELF